MESVVIPDTVTELEGTAFEECTALKTVVLSDGLRTIGDYAFKSCTALKSITIPNTVTTIGKEAFMYCSAMKTVKLSNALKTIDDSAFKGCSALTKISIPDSVTYIGSEAFRWCDVLESVKLPNQLTTLNWCVFQRCYALKNINIPSTVTKIDEYAFYHCDSLETMELPENLVEMGEAVFEECMALKSIEIPEGVTWIPNYAFKGCTSLEEIKLSSVTQYIRDEVFMNCTSLKSIEIPDTVVPYWRGESAWFSGCSNLETVKLSANYTEIQNSMFKDCISLEKIAIPDAVYRINGAAFEGCTRLKEVELPKNVKYIDPYAFMKCNVLKSVVIFDNVTSMEEDIFSYSPKVTIYGVEGSRAESYASEYGIPFKQISYKIAYNKNSSAATGTMSSQSADYGFTKKLNNNKFKRADYDFICWNTKKDGSGTNYTNGEIVKNLASHKDETVTLYAQWKIKTYTITYNLDGGTNKSSNPTTYTHATKTFKLKTPIKTGYTFGGWYTDKKLTKKVIQIAKGTRGDKTLYAKWVPNKYTIKFNGNGATGGKMSDMKNRKYGTSYKLSANKFKREGYYFVRWDTKKKGHGTWYDNKDSVKNLTAANGKTITLYAQWLPVKYTIKYQLRGGYSYYNNPTSYYVTTKTFNLNAPYRYGYTFKGWYSDSKCTKKVTKIKQGTTGNLTLYAKWQKNKK